MVLAALSTSLRFSFPWFLLLLFLLPAVIWTGSKIRTLSRSRKWSVISIRSLIFLFIISALAGAEVVKRSDRLAVFFLLDGSDSVPERARESQVEWVKSVFKERASSRDEAGIIVFGEDSSIELGVAPKMNFGAIRSFVGGENTNAAQAIRLAMAAFPQGYMRRVVLVSDGNETIGSAVEEAKAARAAGAVVDVVPVYLEEGPEVMVREVYAPGAASIGEPFQLRVTVRSSRDCEATIRVFQRTSTGRRMLSPRRVTLQKGDNVFLLTQELKGTGFYEYEVIVETDSDKVKANNQGRAFTVARGEPQVLYVEVDESRGGRVDKVLTREGVKLVRAAPAEVPSDLAHLQAFDAIILSDVAANELDASQHAAIEVAVRDLGVGLVAVGGPNSFGAGGYLGSPIEKALPVDMDIQRRKTLPKGALVLIMHTCEIPSGNAWAREIGLAALNVLSAQDLMGMSGYMYNPGSLKSGDQWIFEIQPVRDKVEMRKAIIEGSAAIGDMPDVTPTLGMAYTALAKVDAAVKRVVIISDGDPAAPDPRILEKMNEAKISVSAVCIAPHGMSDQKMLRSIAEKTGGNYYFVNNANNLPLIYAKEASVVKRGVIQERVFKPAPNHGSELIADLDLDSMPSLRGYVITTAKENATVPLVSDEKDPILAHWRYGLGKSVAFTSDATGRWAADWLGWEDFGLFWTRAVRYVMRDSSRADFSVESFIKDGVGHVRVDAVDEQGKFVNYLKPKAVVTGPGPEYKRTSLQLSQTRPGVYEAAFPVESTGAYMINLAYQNQEGNVSTLTTGLAAGYSREYEYVSTNGANLEKIAAAGGGRVLEKGDSPFVHDLIATPGVTPIWQYLASLAVLMLPVEIFLRRVRIGPGEILASLERAPVVGGLARGWRKERADRATGTYEAAGDASREFGKERETPMVQKTIGPGAVETKGPSDKEQAERPSGPALGKTEYTSKLLEAKKRAADREKRSKPGGGKKEE